MLRMAEPPYLATSDDRHEWSYGQHKHREALGGVRGIVDQSTPKCVDPNLQEVQAYTRRFREDQRRAEIGRENLKMVNRLQSISKNNQHSDPRAPPPAKPPPTMPGSPGAIAQGPSVTTNIKGEKLRSLHGPGRQVAQRQINQDNAALVRRILSVKTTFDAKGEKRDFQRHQSASYLLQRLPGEKRKPKHPRSLPPMRPMRSASELSLPARGLDMLFLPGDLTRACSSSALTNAATAPLPAVQDGEASFSVAPKGQGGTAAWPQQTDEETERRRWLAERDQTGETTANLEGTSDMESSIKPSASVSSMSQPKASKQLTGMSSVDSEVQYAEDWDEYSMASTGSATGTRSRSFLGGDATGRSGTLGPNDSNASFSMSRTGGGSRR